MEEFFKADDQENKGRKVAQQNIVRKGERDKKERKVISRKKSGAHRENIKRLACIY